MTETAMVVLLSWSEDKSIDVRMDFATYYAGLAHYRVDVELMKQIIRDFELKR